MADAGYLISQFPMMSCISWLSCGNLNIKSPFKVRGNKHLFEINNNSYSESTDNAKAQTML